jgi:hypothetical protein
MICGSSTSRLELLAQASDLHVDRPVERAASRRASLERKSRDRRGRVRDEDRQQVELAAGQRDLPAGRVEQTARRDVELPVDEAIALYRGLACESAA